LPTRTEIRGIFAAGVTGGHIYPALAVADEMAKIIDLKVLFVRTGRGAEPKIFKNFKYDHVVVPAIGSDASKLAYIYKNIISLAKISRLLDKFKPDFVFTTGGYIGGITGYIAHKKNIPVFLHESNVEPGISTRKLSSYAEISFCAFEKTAQILKNGLFVGMPVRDGFDLEKDEEFTKEFPMKKILAFGGSEGSSVVDEIVDVVSSKIEDTVFFHIGRKVGNSRVINYDYYDNIPYLMRNCDLVISRAGASTIGEIIQSAKPSILIPWKGSLNGHQEANARYLADIKSAFVVDEDKIDFDEIAKIVSMALDPSFYEQASTTLKKIRPSQKPSVIIAKEIVKRIAFE